MKNLKYNIVTLLLLAAVSLSGQVNGKVFVTNTPESDAIEIKWLNNTIFTTEAVNIYRREGNNGEWEKLNATPINRLESLVIPEGSPEDPTLESLAEGIEGKEPEDLGGFAQLMVGSKAIESALFAEYLGVYFKDQTAERGKRYTYRVALIQSGGQEVDLGTSEPIRVGNFQGIDPPRDIDVAVDQKEDTIVHIKWLPEEGRYFAVNVYRTNATTGVEEKVNPNPVIPTKNADGTYLDAFVTVEDNLKGNTYNYKLRAIDFFGREGKDSRNFRMSFQDDTPPLPPKDLELMKNNGTEFFIFWNEPKELVNVKGYNVHVGRQVEGPFEKINNSLIAPDVTQSRHAISEWGSYFVFVESVGENGVNASTYVKGIDMLDVEPPAAPEKVEIRADAGAITISWKANQEDDLLGYQVFRSIENQPDQPFALITPDMLTATQFVDKIPEVAQNRFFYKVAAVDTSFNISERTMPIGAQMPDVTAPLQPFIKDIEAQESAVVVHWLSNTEQDLEGYRLSRSETPESGWQSLGQDLLASTTSSFTDITVQAGTKYYYRLEAIDQAGNVSPASEPYAARPWGAIQEANISNFQATLDNVSGEVQLQWTPSNMEELDGTIVYRQEGAARFMKLSPFLKQQAYTDTTTEPGQTYSYKVKLFYTSGKVVESETKEITIGRE